MKKAVEANCNRDKRFGESDLMKWKICRKTGEAWIFFFFLLRLFEFEFFSLCCSPLCTNHQNGEFWQTVLLGPKEGTKSNHCYMRAWSQATPLLDKYTLLDLGMLCFCSDNRVLATDTHTYNEMHMISYFVNAYTKEIQVCWYLSKVGVAVDTSGSTWLHFPA